MLAILVLGLGGSLQLLLPVLSPVVAHLLPTAVGASAMAYGAVRAHRRARTIQGHSRTGRHASAVAFSLLSLSCLLKGVSALLPSSSPTGFLGSALSVVTPIAVAAAVTALAKPLRSWLTRSIQAIDTVAVAAAVVILIGNLVLGPAAAVSSPMGSMTMWGSFLTGSISFAAVLVVASRSAVDRHAHGAHLIAGALGAFIVQSAIEAQNSLDGKAWYADGAGACLVIGGLMVALAGHSKPPAADIGGRRWLAGEWTLIPYVLVILAYGAVLGQSLRQETTQSTSVIVFSMISGLLILRQIFGTLVVRDLLKKLVEQRALLVQQADRDAQTIGPGAFVVPTSVGSAQETSPAPAEIAASSRPSSGVS